MRRRLLYIMIVGALTAAAQDTVLNRSVVVEREFEPIIQSPGKVNMPPTAVQAEVPAAEVTYSDYTSTDAAPTTNINPLLSQPTRFTQPTPLRGWLRGGLGHPLTLFNFAYEVRDKKQNFLDLYVNHHGQWGRRTLSETNFGLLFTHKFRAMNVYFGLKGEDLFYTKYGRYYDGSDGYNKNRGLTIASYDDFERVDKQAQWRARIYVGVKSAPKEDIQYKAEVGYQAMNVPGIASEHQFRTEANINAKLRDDQHRLGMNLYMQNNFYTVDTALFADRIYNDRHNLRMEPFYEFHGDKILLHTGVNLDLNIGKGQLLSSNENISFAPSPNIRFEAQLAPKWMTVYGKAVGRFGLGSLQAYLEANKYMEVIPCVTSKAVAGYTPIDAEVGFHFKPQKHLLIEIHGGYAYFMNSKSYVAFLEPFVMDEDHQILPGTFSDFVSDYHRAKVGAKAFYHYRDIIQIHLSGDYYYWKLENITKKARLEDVAKDIDLTPGRVYDRPDWEINLRIDGRIDEHWTLYSDNHFAGSRWAITTGGEVHLPALIDMNLGAQYEFTKLNLAVFAQINNFICRRNHVLYGYQSLLINGLAGVSWKF
ncbi:MAG: hypothetical protein J5612_03240 [Paludibacteraceae bacterium]|nr:hypothetical protein [Paludibacteraceae bacterium]